MSDFIPDSEFKPDGKAEQKAQSGELPSFISDSDFVSDEQKYGGTSGALKAAGLGAARSASFGLSDEFLTRVGLLKPEELAAYKEQNPTATTLGEAGGVLGAVFAPETGLLGLASAPVKAVAKIGGAVTEAALPVSSRIAGALAGEAASPVINKVLTQAGALSAGSAIEGAAYGLGQSISEHALGDPDLTGEKVMANIGTSALVGGALGGLFGSIKGAVEAKYPKFLSEVDQKAIESGDFKALANASDMSESQKEGFIDGLTKLRKDAPEIKAAAKSLDAPILPGMISDSEAVRKGQSLLLEGPPSIAGLKAQQLAKKGFDRAGEALESTLGADSDITKASLGDTLKDVVSKSVETQSAPINALYDELKQSYETLPLSEKALKQISRNIRNIEDVPLSPQAKSIAYSAAERVESLKTVDDVKRLKSILNQELGLSATPIQKRVTAIIADKLGNLEENSIVRFAEKEAKTSKDKEKILSLLDQREAANAQYSVFKDKIQRLGEVLGRKKVHGAQDFLDFIEGLTPEKIADKLSSKNNSEFLEWFSKEFPEGMQSISQYQKGLIRDAAMKDGEFSIRRAITVMDKIPEEYKNKIFNEENLKSISDVKKYIQSFPKNFNPSNTSNASAFRHFFESPTGAVVGNVRDLAIESFIKGATSSGQDEASFFIDGLSKLERNAQKTTKDISTGVRAIFSREADEAPIRSYLGVGSSKERKELHDEHKDKILDLNSSPEKLIDHIDKNTEILNQIAPRTSRSIQSTMIRATQFLKSKLPDTEKQAPLSAKYEPSDAELSKWHKYFNAVENPTNALHEVAHGTITPETMESLTVVYPKMLTEMRQSVTEKMVQAVSKKQIIPYRTKMALSMFLDSDLVLSLLPVNILANQNMLATATQGKNESEQQMKMNGVNHKSLGKLEKSSHLLTASQASSQRQET
jgi:hypothetical protein